VLMNTTSGIGLRSTIFLRTVKFGPEFRFTQPRRTSGWALPRILVEHYIQHTANGNKTSKCSRLNSSDSGHSMMSLVFVELIFTSLQNLVQSSSTNQAQKSTCLKTYTKKLSYRKDDRAVHMGALKVFGCPSLRQLLFPKSLMDFCSD